MNLQDQLINRWMTSVGHASRYLTAVCFASAKDAFVTSWYWYFTHPQYCKMLNKLFDKTYDIYTHHFYGIKFTMKLWQENNLIPSFFNNLFQHWSLVFEVFLIAKPLDHATACAFYKTNRSIFCSLELLPRCIIPLFLSTHSKPFNQPSGNVIS